MRWEQDIINKMQEAITRKCRLEAEPKFNKEKVKVVIKLVPPKEIYEYEEEKIIE